MVVAASLGRALRKLHSIAIDGLGYIDGEGRSRPRGLAHPALLLKFVDRWRGAAASRAGIDRSSVERAVEHLRANAHAFAVDGPRLVHADMRSDHVMVDGSSVSGLLDLEFCQGGEPLYDLAYWDFNHPDPEFTDAIFAGYGLERDPDVERVFRCCRLIVGLQYLSWFAGDEQPWASLAATVAENLDADLGCL